MSRIPARLKPKDADGAEQSEEGADLELPLLDDPTLFREKNEREESGHDDGGTNEDRVDARSHVIERNHLSDLVNHVRQRRQETDAEDVPVETRSAALKSIKGEGKNSQKRDRITIKILREGIVESVEIELEKRWCRPDENGRKNGGITLGEIFFVRGLRSVAGLNRRHG